MVCGIQKEVVYAYIDPPNKHTTNTHAYAHPHIPPSPPTHTNKVTAVVC